MDGLWPKIEESVNALKVELVEARRKSGKSEDTKSKIDPLLEEVVVRVREQGRLLATLAEQGGAGSGKEILQAVQDIKMAQQNIMERQKMMEDRRRSVMDREEMDDRFRLFRDREKDDSVRGDTHLPRRIQELDDILKNLPFEFASKSGPEVTFNFLIKNGLLHESMIELFGGRAGTIEAIRLLINRNTRRLSKEDQK
jgi:hypothetical protein